jgi:hypothetical protein
MPPPCAGIRAGSLTLAAIWPKLSRSRKGANSRLWYICYVMDVGVPFVVRRARLLMGMTQAEFAELLHQGRASSSGDLNGASANVATMPGAP